MANRAPLPVTMRRGDWTRRSSASDRIVCDAPQFELQCSHTDEGDPWCIVYDRERDEIVLQHCSD